MARSGVDGGALEIRLPVDADRPVLNAALFGLGTGGLVCGFVVFEHRGLGGPVVVGAPLGVVVGLLTGVLAHASLGRRSRGHRLLCDDEGIAFTVGGQVRWRIGWDDVLRAGIVDAHLTWGGPNDVGFCTFLVLDLDPATAPRHPSLPRHDDRWWFSLLRAGDRAPLLQRQLQRRIPGRVDRARHQDDVPFRLVVREDSPSRLFR